MFFQDRIRSIKPNDKVLEVGPGATPYYRSDVFLELNYNNENERIAQSGHVGILETEKTVVYYDGTIFPFEDNEFDYVVCSHVLEHVTDVNLFISELTRIAKRGYLEFPIALYDYLYDISEHLNFCYYDESTIFWGRKSDFELSKFQPLTSILNKTLTSEYFTFVDTFKNLFFQGFEWETSIKTIKTSELKELIFLEKDVDFHIKEALRQKKTERNISVGDAFKQKLKNYLFRILN